MYFDSLLELLCLLYNIGYKSGLVGHPKKRVLCTGQANILVPYKFVCAQNSTRNILETRTESANYDANII